MNFLVKKIKEKVNNINEKQLNDLNMLYYDHVNKKTYIHNSLNILIKQIELGLEDLYERHYNIKNGLKPKDNSSLKSFILKYGEHHGPKLYQEKNLKTASTLESFKEKYGEEGEERYKEYCIKKGASLQGFIMRHGEEEGPIKHKEYWSNTNFSIKKSKFIERYGEEEGLKEHQKTLDKIGTANTLDGYKERYGDEVGAEKFFENNRKKAKSLSKEQFVERLLKEGKSIDEILLSIEDRWSNSLSTFQRKFGLEDGLIRYNNRIENMKKSNPLCIEYYIERNIDENTAFDLISNLQFERNSKNNFYSKESLRCLLPITTQIEQIYDYKCMFAENEFFIKLRKEEYDISKKRLFFYDFTFPDLGIIIEYHGVNYHEDLNYDNTKNMTFDDFYSDYKTDLFKKWVAEQRGYDVLIIRSWNKKEDLNNLYNYLIERNCKICQTKFI